MQLRDVVLRRAVLALLPLAALSVGTKPVYAEPGDGSVYVMTNAAAGNSILVYDREENGKLSLNEEVWTGGKGAGSAPDPLGSQGALALDSSEHFLIAVNAGTDDVSVFSIHEDGLHREQVASSGGTHPISVTVKGDKVFVLNAGGTPNISGFELTWRGHLRPIAGGSHVIPGGAASGPAEVSFNPDGDALLVTEKATGNIDIFSLNDDSAITRVASLPGSGVTPFGFNFARRGVMVVSEAAGGAVDGSTISSYWLDNDSHPALLDPITKSLLIGQSAACWVAVTPNGHYAFTTNTASNSIASFWVSNTGKLTLLNKAAASVMAGSIPTDMAVTPNGRYLYAIGGPSNSLFVFRIQDGTLTPIETLAGIPTTAQGIAAR